MTLQFHSWTYMQKKQQQKKNMAWKYTCTPMFIAALFTIANP